ncbi:MAG TPA: metalloregulator ArsR/SmtB family transcription factor [Candidatus Saccharimonadales bacterium]|nr:metalloregulator ArsR/SmtB family transcription factor [Candidatus Saccharimonadales bacterium]
MDMFYALAEPKRRSIIELLANQGQLSASAISQTFHVSSSAISQHLKVLRETKFVLMEKHAQQRMYQLNPEMILEVEAWAKQTTQLWNGRFDALDVVLDAEKNKSKRRSI